MGGFAERREFVRRSVASRWVAIELGTNRSCRLREERCQGGVTGGVPPHKGGPERPDRP